MCLSFCCNPQIVSFTSLAVRTKLFWGLKHLDIGYLVNTNPPIVLAESLKNALTGVFVEV